MGGCAPLVEDVIKVNVIKGVNYLKGVMGGCLDGTYMEEIGVCWCR
jgi:hypothetical protein